MFLTGSGDLSCGLATRLTNKCRRNRNKSFLWLTDSSKNSVGSIPHVPPFLHHFSNNPPIANRDFEKPCFTEPSDIYRDSFYGAWIPNVLFVYARTGPSSTAPLTRAIGFSFSDSFVSISHRNQSGRCFSLFLFGSLRVAPNGLLKTDKSKARMNFSDIMKEVPAKCVRVIDWRLFTACGSRKNLLITLEFPIGPHKTFRL